MTAPQAVLDAVARRLAEEPTVVMPALKVIAGIDALPENPAPLEPGARALNARRIADRRRAFRSRAYDSGHVRAMLGGVSRQAVSQRVASGRLLATEISGRAYFPDWQFNADGVQPQLPVVLDALRGGGETNSGAQTPGTLSPLAADAVMRTALPEEDGASPADLLARGDVDLALHYIVALRAGS